MPALVVLYLAVIVLMLASLWKVFTKAGKPGWACIVPIYNILVMLQIAGKPDWWIVLYFVPIANIVVSVLVSLAIAERFGKSVGFGVGLILLGVVFYPILAFGDAKYLGVAGSAPPAPPAPPIQQPGPGTPAQT